MKLFCLQDNILLFSRLFFDKILDTNVQLFMTPAQVSIGPESTKLVMDIIEVKLYIYSHKPVYVPAEYQIRRP